jgi:hypothetical protein
LEEDDSDTPGPAHTLGGSRLECVALKREQQEWLESKHHEKLSHRKEDETKHSCRKHSSRKINDDTPVGRSGRIAVRREQCNVVLLLCNDHKNEHTLLGNSSVNVFPWK